MQMKKYTLGEIAYFVENRISSEDILLSQYVTTDSLLQNKKGRTLAQNLPPQKCSLTHFKEGDVLLGNIRPYLKKIWFANIDGGCSQDVLVLRAKERKYSSFLYALLMQDSFFDYEMKATKGSKMPRGDKTHILNFPISNIKNKIGIGNFLSALDEKIALNSRINAKLEAMAKRLYDYWFVQFEFPFDFAQGKPDAGGTFGNARPPISQAGHTSTLAGQNRTYKTGGGKMVWNEQLKREIPEGWETGNLYMIADYINGLACQNFRPTVNEKSLPVIKIREMNEGITEDTERVSAAIPEKYKIKSGDILFSWSATLEVVIWNGGNCGLNQHIFKVEPKNYFSHEYVYQQLNKYVVNFQKQAEARKTTMGHITSEHINQSRIVLPPEQVVQKFTKKIKPLSEMQINLKKENLKLTALRDRLLPLLMNGQVAVK